MGGWSLDWEFDLHVGTVLTWCMAGDTPDNLAWDMGGHVDAVEPGRDGRPGFSLTIGNPGLLIYLPYIYVISA